MKIENKKAKQNDFIKQKSETNFCFIKACFI
jgi:hypothetical protein